MRIAIAITGAMLMVIQPLRASDATPSVVAYPIFREYYACVEHPAGNLAALGDALGSDCHIQKLITSRGRTFMKSFAGKGRNNSDWYGFGKDVLSPCTCNVVDIRVNPITNRPGILGKPPASAIRLQREDGVLFVLAHIDNIQAKIGDRIQAGQKIGTVGNNGYARMPHIHVGAWKDNAALQIRFDLEAMGRLFEQ